MKYDVNRIEFVKTQKIKYVIQMSEHIFQIWIDCIAHNDICLKYIFLLCSNIFCEICSAALCLLSSSVFERTPKLMYLLPDTLRHNGFLQI